MVFEAITDRIRKRGLLNKNQSGDMDEIEPLDSNIPDIPVPLPIKSSNTEEMTRSSFTKGLEPEPKKPSTAIKDLSNNEDIESAFSNRDDKIVEDMELEPLPIESTMPKSSTSDDDIPYMPETPLTSDIPSISETPKVEAKIPETPIKIPKMPDTETIISDKLSKEEKKSGPSLTDTIKSKIKTVSEYKKNLGENLGGSTLTDRDYALRGEYKGVYSKEELNDRITSLKSRREQLVSEISDMDKDLIGKRQESKEISDSLRGTKDMAERAQFNSELKRINDEIKRIEDKREGYVKNANRYEQEILDNRRQVNEYDMAVRRGRMKASTSARIGKKLQALGEGAETVSSGVYGGKSFGKGDWFGPKGFLSQPYKQANITSSVVQPVRTRLSNLDAITRSTGAIVGHGMVDAVTTVRANRNISPFGVPGTIAGARKQFEYNIPAKKILPGDVTTNISRDIMPSIFAPTRTVPVTTSLSPMEYQQIVQQDGTVINVPIQQRAAKHFGISLNRFNQKHVSGPKVIVKPVGSRLERGINSVGSLKLTDIKIGKSNFNMNLISPMSFNKKSKENEIIEYRKSEKKKSLVNMDSVAVINKNLDKLLSKKKKSK